MYQTLFCPCVPKTYQSTLISPLMAHCVTCPSPQLVAWRDIRGTIADIGPFPAPNVTKLSANLFTKRGTKEPISPFQAPVVTWLFPCLEACKKAFKKTYRTQSLCLLLECKHSPNLVPQIRTRLPIMDARPLPFLFVTKMSPSLVALRRTRVPIQEKKLCLLPGWQVFIVCL